MCNEKMLKLIFKEICIPDGNDSAFGGLYFTNI